MYQDSTRSYSHYQAVMHGIHDCTVAAIPKLNVDDSSYCSPFNTQILGPSGAPVSQIAGPWGLEKYSFAQHLDPAELRPESLQDLPRLGALQTDHRLQLPGAGPAIQA